jgi:hypothetical protein
MLQKRALRIGGQQGRGPCARLVLASRHTFPGPGPAEGAGAPQHSPIMGRLRTGWRILAFTYIQTSPLDPSAMAGNLRISSVTSLYGRNGTPPLPARENRPQARSVRLNSIHAGGLTPPVSPGAVPGRGSGGPCLAWRS